MMVFRVETMQTYGFDTVLAQQYFLSGLDEAERDHLIAGAGQWTLKPGQALFRQGESARYFFVLRAWYSD